MSATAFRRPPNGSPHGAAHAETSAYLSRPVRSLEQACRDIAGCAGRSEQGCARCRVAELCPLHAAGVAVRLAS